MGQRSRHFFALMKKNWIIWKRTLGASLCELFCPVALMAIMAIARSLITQNEYSPQSNMQKSILMAPMLNIPANANSSFSLTMDSSFANMSAAASPNSSNQAASQAAYLNNLLAQYGTLYGNLANFSLTNLNLSNPMTMFSPIHCT
jgi:hypothetical protein